MCRIILAASFLFLFLFSAVSRAQSFQEYLEQRKSPVMQEAAKNSSKALVRLQWNGLGGNGIILGLLKDQDFRRELGVSEEQYERIQETAKNVRDPRKNPEIMKIHEEMESIKAAHGPTLQSADEETKKRFLDLDEKMTVMTITTGRDELNPFSIADALEITLTPQQKQKMKEVQLVASLSDVSIFSPRMFEALGLTDAQKREMEAIKKKLESEFEKPLEELASRNLEITNRMYDGSKKKDEGMIGITEELLGETAYKQITEDMRKISDETQAYGKQYTMQFKTKMLDVLTDEQLARLQDMIDNPSGLVKMMQAKIKGWREKKGEWQPGPDSWKPGDPIPEEYLKQREEQKARFPRKK